MEPTNKQRSNKTRENFDNVSFQVISTICTVLPLSAFRACIHPRTTIPPGRPEWFVTSRESTGFCTHKKKRSKNKKNRFLHHRPQSKRKTTKTNHRCGDHSPSCHHCPQRQTITSNTTSATTTIPHRLLLTITITVNRATTVVMTAQRTTHSFTCPRR